MEIISHRGFWLTPDEKNTEIAFQRSFESGFGTETDVRDSLGELVISHDPALGGEMPFHEFIKLASRSHSTLALNVKSDGISRQIIETLSEMKYENYFVFDMSGPEYLTYRRAGHPTFTRISEFENPDLEKVSPAGVWLDAFESDDWRLDWLIQNNLPNLRIAIVSPELHSREHLEFWSLLKQLEIHLRQNVVLCTDFPEDAKQYFGGIVD